MGDRCRDAVAKTASAGGNASRPDSSPSARIPLPLPRGPSPSLLLIPPISLSLFLAADLDDYVSHTSTLLTSLQSQLSALLSSQPTSALASQPGLAGAASWGQQQQQQQNPPSPQQPPAAVVQARAVAAALSIAQQAQARSAAGGGGPSSPPDSQPLQGDALADVQLPTFAQRFAALQAAAVAKPAAAAGNPTPTAAAASAAVLPAGSARWREASENSPPQPRALPQSLLQQRGAAGSGQQTAEAAGFQWRPLSAAG